MIVLDSYVAAAPTVTNFTNPSKRAVQDQDPTALQSKVATLTRELNNDPQPERNQSCPNNATHPNVNPVGQCCTGEDRNGPKCKHDNRMANRVQHRQHKAATLSFRGTADISNRGDVIPVDAVAHP
jgi:hypothetical protein